MSMILSMAHCLPGYVLAFHHEGKYDIILQNNLLSIALNFPMGICLVVLSNRVYTVLYGIYLYENLSFRL